MKRLLTLLLALLPITDAQARAQVILPTGETTQISRIWDGTRIVGVNADGSVNVSQAGVWTASQDPAAVGLSVSGTITATCADPCNSPETANSTVKRTLGWMHGVAIYVVTSTWTGTVKVEGTADNTHWIPLTTLNGGGFTPAFNRNTVFTNPTSDTYFVPNTTPGMLSVRIRGVTGSGSMDVVINVNNADAYNVLLPVSSWVFGTAKIPQRGVLTGGSDNTTNCDGTGCMIPNIVNNVAPVTTSVGQYVRQVPADTTSGAVTLSSNCADPCTGSNQSGTIEIKIAGQGAVFAHLSAALSTGQTIKFEQSIDDNDWSTVQYFAWSGGARGTTATNPWTVPSDWSIMFREGARFARIRCVSGCDGTHTVTWTLDASLVYQNNSMSSIAISGLQVPPAGQLFSAADTSTACNGAACGRSVIVSNAQPAGTEYSVLVRDQANRAEDAAHTTGDIGLHMLGVRKDTSTQATSADADYGSIGVDAYSAIYARPDHPNRISCVLTTTATARTALGGSCAAPGAGLSIYVTGLTTYVSLTATTTNYNQIQYGTGGTCGTGTTTFFHCFNSAAFNGCEPAFSTPIKIPANNEICILNGGTATKVVMLQGFIAP